MAMAYQHLSVVLAMLKYLLAFLVDQTQPIFVVRSLPPRWEILHHASGPYGNASAWRSSTNSRCGCHARDLRRRAFRHTQAASEYLVGFSPSRRASASLSSQPHFGREGGRRGEYVRSEDTIACFGVANGRNPHSIEDPSPVTPAFPLPTRANSSKTAPSLVASNPCSEKCAGHLAPRGGFWAGWAGFGAWRTEGFR